MLVYHFLKYWFTDTGIWGNKTITEFVEDFMICFLIAIFALPIFAVDVILSPVEIIAIFIYIIIKYRSKTIE